MVFDVKRIKAKFLIKFPHFGHVLNQLEIVIDESEKTAATDGEKLYFNPHFMSSLNEEQQLFAFAHEVLHVALDHINRCLGKNHYNWNIATDAVINDYLRRVIELDQPDGTIEIVNALNYTAEQIYEKLQKKDEEEKKKKDKDKGSHSNQNGDGSSTGTSYNGDSDQEDDDKGKDGSSSSGDDSREDEDHVGHDSHGRWKEAAKKHQKEKEERGENGNDSSSDEIDERNEFGENDNKRKKNSDNYLNNGSTNSGSRGGHSPNRGDIGDDYDSNQLIDWRQYLKDHLRVDYDWDSTDLYEEDGVINPTFKQQPKPKTQVVIDSSASISTDLIRNFLSECLSILDYSELEIGFFDDKFYGFQSVRTEDDIKELKKPGYGGTDFNAALSAFQNGESSYYNKIIFTDGYAPMPKDECDALWVVVGYHPPKINPPGGKVITISGEEYDQLSRRRESYHR